MTEKIDELSIPLNFMLVDKELLKEILIELEKSSTNHILIGKLKLVIR